MSSSTHCRCLPTYPPLYTALVYTSPECHPLLRAVLHALLRHYVSSDIFHPTDVVSLRRRLRLLA